MHASVLIRKKPPITLTTAMRTTLSWLRQQLAVLHASSRHFELISGSWQRSLTIDDDDDDVDARFSLLCPLLTRVEVALPSII